MTAHLQTLGSSTCRELKALCFAQHIPSAYGYCQRGILSTRNRDSTFRLITTLFQSLRTVCRYEARCVEPDSAPRTVKVCAQSHSAAAEGVLCPSSRRLAPFPLSPLSEHKSSRGDNHTEDQYSRSCLCEILQSTVSTLKISTTYLSKCVASCILYHSETRFDTLSCAWLLLLASIPPPSLATSAILSVS